MTFTASRDSTEDTGVVRSVPVRARMPALAIATSRRPKRSTTACDGASRRLAGADVGDRPPWPSVDDIAAPICGVWGSMSTIATFAPRPQQFPRRRAADPAGLRR